MQSVILLAQSSAAIESIWDFIVKGGPVMIPIALCSLIAMAIVVERLIVLRRSRIIPPQFASRIKELLDSGSDGRRRAADYCKTADTPLGDIFAVGIRRLGEPLELLERHVQDAGGRAIGLLRRRLRALTLIASLSPLLGLLGTIFGMIEAFQTVAISQEALGKTELLASGIYAAMITTAAGLIVAIPVIVCYHWISAKIDGLIEEMDRMVVEFVDQYAMTHRVESDSASRLGIIEGNGRHTADQHAAASSRSPVASTPD